MSLAVGARLGPYEVLAPLGAGGMGEVYRARDTKLNRDVALKTLPATLAADPDYLARFKRESQLLASLNHANIAAVYGFEDADSVHAIAMELVEGEDLAERIARGPIPVGEALAIARQLADALEAAHEHGIIHRDLKPANIKLRPDGTVKVLDFGLAKALDPTTGSSVSAMVSPTLSIHATQAGVILGTAAYMSPEQARGRVVDRRADIWAFGAVLYEMLTGRRAFEGETVSDSLAYVITKEPDWAALPASVPSGLRRLLARCLTKDPRMRLRDIGEARVAIDELGRIPSDEESPAAITPRSLPAWRRAVPWVVALVAQPRRRGRLAAFTDPCASARSTIQHSTPTRSITPDRTDLRPGHFPGWQHDRRLGTARDRKPDQAAPRQPGIRAHPGDGRRRGAVLLAERRLDCVLCKRRAEEGSRQRWSGIHDLQGHGNRFVGGRRHHRLRRWRQPVHRHRERWHAANRRQGRGD